MMPVSAKIVGKSPVRVATMAADVQFATKGPGDRVSVYL
jgi:hypothetical protein